LVGCVCWGLAGRDSWRWPSRRRRWSLVRGKGQRTGMGCHCKVICVSFGPVQVLGGTDVFFQYSSITSSFRLLKVKLGKSSQIFRKTLRSTM
jgi:hypothetical protein